MGEFMRACTPVLVFGFGGGSGGGGVVGGIDGGIVVAAVVAIGVIVAVGDGAGCVISGAIVVAAKHTKHNTPRLICRLPPPAFPPPPNPPPKPHTSNILRRRSSYPSPTLILTANPNSLTI